MSSWTSWLEAGKEYAVQAGEHTARLAESTKAVMKEYSPTRDFVSCPEVLSLNMQVADLDTVPYARKFPGLLVPQQGNSGSNNNSGSNTIGMGSLFQSNACHLLVTPTQLARMEPEGARVYAATGVGAAPRQGGKGAGR